MRVVPPVSSVPPPAIAQASKPFIDVRGHVYGPGDTTTVVPGAELVFSRQEADSGAYHWRVFTKTDGSYQVAVPAGATYRIALNKDGINIETQEMAMPEKLADTDNVVKNFYLSSDERDHSDESWPNTYFNINRSALRPEAIATLDTMVNILLAEPRLKLLVEGHTDEMEVPRGQPNREKYLLQLGKQRAHAARNYLTKQGVPENSLSIVSYGSKRPAAPNDTPENRQLNRRIEFKPVYTERQESGYRSLKKSSFASSKRVITVPGKVYSSEDSTTVISGVELIFRNTLADSAMQRMHALTGPDGSYRVRLLSGLTYQVILNMNGRQVGVKKCSAGMSADTSSLVQNFYIDYDIKPMFDGLGPMVFFDANQAALRLESKAILDNLVPMLKANPGIGISIEGHAEPHEAPRNQPQLDRYLMQLGQHRAQAAAEYLSKRGVPASRIITKSYGGKRPAAPNDNPENRQLNRRVEFKSSRLDISPKKATGSQTSDHLNRIRKPTHAKISSAKK